MTRPANTSSDVLAERYGSDRGVRRTGVALAGVVGVALIGWLVWAAWFHSTPAVTSDLISFEVQSEHEVTASVDAVVSPDAANADCTVLALAQDHSPVGELRFTPRSGLNEVTIRTERRAGAVEVVGCTADGQNRPR